MILLVVYCYTVHLTDRAMIMSALLSLKAILSLEHWMLLEHAVTTDTGFCDAPVRAQGSFCSMISSINVLRSQ